MRYIPALDGLRAFAVGAVLVFHADSPLAPGGFLGVSLFFTLSGFLITSLLLAEQESTGSIALGRFYARRARRLLPAAYACLAGVVVLSGSWAMAVRHDLPGDVVAALANVANWRFAFSPESYADLFGGEASPVAHFWSLSIEEQLYLLLPLVLLVTLRRGVRFALAVVGVLSAVSLGATLATSDHDLIYNGTHTRAAELLVGVALALVVSMHPMAQVRRGAWSAVGIASAVALGAIVYLADLADGWLYRGGFVAIAFVSAALILAVSRGGAPAAVLEARPLVAIGRASYGIYLFHWPVFLLLDAERVGVDGLVLFVLQCSVTGALAAFSYHGLEAPVRLGRRLASGRSAALAGCTVAATIAVSVAMSPAPRLTATESLLALGSDVEQGELLVFGGDTGGDDQPVEAEATVALDMEAAPRTSVVAPASQAPQGWSWQRASTSEREPLLLMVGSEPAPLAPLRAAGFRVADATAPDCPLNVETPGPRCQRYLTRWAELAAWLEADGVIVAAGENENSVWAAEAESVRQGESLSTIAARRGLTYGRLADAVDDLVGMDIPVALFFAHPVGLGFDNAFGRLAATQPDLHGIARSDDDLAGLVTSRAFAVGDVAAAEPATASEAPPRILVLGDSTSLGFARALAEVGGSRVVVAWGGANGCPIARVAAMRATWEAEWRPPPCDPFDVVLPDLLQRAQPDLALLVVGPTELMEQRYPGHDGSFSAGDPTYTEFHMAELGELRALLADHGVELLIADAPRVDSGAYATPAMAQPWRLDALNELFARAAQEWPDVGLLRFHDAVAALEAERGTIRSDGVHVDIEPLTDLVRFALLEDVLEAVVALNTE